MQPFIQTRRVKDNIKISKKCIKALAVKDVRIELFNLFGLFTPGDRSKLVFTKLTEIGSIICCIDVRYNHARAFL